MCPEACLLGNPRSKLTTNTKNSNRNRVKQDTPQSSKKTKKNKNKNKSQKTKTKKYWSCQVTWHWRPWLPEPQDNKILLFKLLSGHISVNKLKTYTTLFSYNKTWFILPCVFICFCVLLPSPDDHLQNSRECICHLFNIIIKYYTLLSQEWLTASPSQTRSCSVKCQVCWNSYQQAEVLQALLVHTLLGTCDLYVL